ncbi:MAG: TetR/AcrR family transcriptional regulator [Acidimicrobiales bacterium]|nr:TetR/AcrR family transcriptional regulator [Acidimicrobiales bacterium]
MGRRSGITADQTRKELLDATIRVLRRCGYEGTRVSEIAREAGLTTGAIYSQFNSKAELLTAAIANEAPAALAGLLESGDAESVLTNFKEYVVAIAGRGGSLGPLLLDLIVAGSRDPSVAETVVPVFASKERVKVELIRRAQAAGAVDPELQPEALARLATILAFGALVVATLDLEPVDREAWDRVIERVLGAVEPERVTRPDRRSSRPTGVSRRPKSGVLA